MQWTFFTFLLAVLLLELTPGPNMAYLATLALSRGRTAGLIATAGVAFGLAVHAMVAGLGAGVLIQQYPLLYEGGPDKYSGAYVRVEHWVVAERQGQTAALNMMGHRRPFEAIPFFWSQHYDVPINYVGHAEKWDEVAIEGDVPAKDCVVPFKQGGRTQAI